MNYWNPSKTDYYLDFGLVPLLVGATAITLPLSLPALAAGFLFWSLAEYWIHRSLLHRTFKRSHWIHHRYPAGFVAAPTWVTVIAHLTTAAVLLGSLPLAVAAGAFVGIELGYLIYIAVHDRIHHARPPATGWLRSRWRLHMLHHGGREVNFGVATSLWDRVFGTYQGVLTRS